MRPYQRLIPARYVANLRTLWTAAWAERSSPRDTGWAVGIGVWAGASPALFVRPVVAVALATLLGKNRLFSYLGSLVTSNFVSGPWFVLGQIQIAHRIRTGRWLAVSIESVRENGAALLLDWLIGFSTVGLLAAVLVGLAAYVYAKRRATRVQHANAQAATTVAR